jgi:hypothetical protein
MLVLALGTGARVLAVGEAHVAPGGTRKDPVGLLAAANSTTQIERRHELVIRL